MPKESFTSEEKMHNKIIEYQEKEAHTNAGEAIRALIRAGLKAEGYKMNESQTV